MLAKDILARNVVTVTECTPVKTLAKTLSENSISAAPVGKPLR